MGDNYRMIAAVNFKALSLQKNTDFGNGLPFLVLIFQKLEISIAAISLVKTLAC